MSVVPAPADDKPRLDHWENRTQWPLATVAVIFLAAYSIRVLAQPQGRAETAIDAVITVTWGLFLVDYLTRFWLATDKKRWFVRHLLDLAIVALPLLRPLRLLRLIVLVAALQKAIGGAIRGRVIIYAALGAEMRRLADAVKEQRPQPDS